MNAASRALAQTFYGQQSAFGALLCPRMLSIIGLGLAVFFSGLGLVYNKDMNRRLHTDLQMQQYQQDHLQTEWSQLLLEKSTWAMQARVEQVANQQLDMSLPSGKNTILIRR